MLLFHATQVKCSIKDRVIFDIPEINIYKGNRIGLVGKNGAGKSLLFKGLLGEFEIDSVAEIMWYGTQAYVQQIDATYANTGLSGGEQTRKRLEEAFALAPHVLLLDEPTNHLDWQRIEELERKLKHFEGAFVIVSHDRALLDEVCNEIWELENGKLSFFQGNYSFYEEEKRRQWNQQVVAYENYDKEKRRLLKRYRDKQDQSKGMNKAPSRMGNSEWQLYKNKAAAKRGKIERVSKVLRERLERLEDVRKPIEPEQIILAYHSFTEVHRKHVLMTPELTQIFSKKKLYTTPSLSLKNGSKTAIIGANGSGKTTLLKQIFSYPHVDIAKNVKVGLFEQQLESIPEDVSALEYVSAESTMEPLTIRTVLSRLRLKEDEILKKIGELSGGERVKVAFAKLMSADYNLLVLDEPTNHLDVEAIEALEELLIAYPGTILFTSHDRRFVEKIADHLWIFHEAKVEPFTGSKQEWNESKNLQKQPNLEEKLILETRLTELISRISMPSPKDDVVKLDQEYQEVLKKLRSM